MAEGEEKEDDLDLSDEEFEKRRWTAKDEDMIIRKQPATSVYINPFDQIVIRQQAEEYGEDDPYLTVDRHHLPALIAKLKSFV